MQFLFVLKYLWLCTESHFSSGPDLYISVRGADIGVTMGVVSIWMYTAEFWDNGLAPEPTKRLRCGYRSAPCPTTDSFSKPESLNLSRNIPLQRFCAHPDV